MPELEDLERRGFFSAAELKQIAAKRTDFEYLLKRRTPLRADFLRWVAFSPHESARQRNKSKSQLAATDWRRTPPRRCRLPFPLLMQAAEHAAAERPSAGTWSTRSRWRRCG